MSCNCEGSRQLRRSAHMADRKINIPKNSKAAEPSQGKLLNIGCGGVFHPTWVNVDVAPADGSVRRVSASKPLPFADGSFDAVYASHVLEHIAPEDSRAFVIECMRVLRTGGVLRLVVPDLEEIARTYLERLADVSGPSPQREREYDWLLLELLDQLVRDRTEGAMGPFLRNLRPGDPLYQRILVDRIGIGAATPSDVHSPRDVATMSRRAWKLIAEGLVQLVAALLLGREGAASVREGLFRRSGEVHRWMYDRYSLRRLLAEAGFCDVRMCDPAESTIARFSDYGLDVSNGVTRKPNSLYVEARKP